MSPNTALDSNLRSVTGWVLSSASDTLNRKTLASKLCCYLPLKIVLYALAHKKVPDCGMEEVNPVL
jgi:hypothetical protein